MARPAAGRKRGTDGGDFSPPVWLLIFLAGSALLRFEAGGWRIYPGSWGLSLLLGALLVRGAWAERGQRFPALAGVALGGYLTLMAAWRGETRLATVIGGAVAMHFLWGWAAYRWSFRRQGAGGATDGVVLWLAASVGAGLLGWGASFLAPEVCQVFNCAGVWRWPAPFLAGWNSQDQWWALLVFSLPIVGPLVIEVFHAPRGSAGRSGLYAILACCTAAWLAGARWWSLALAAGGLLLAARAAGRGRRQGHLRLVGALALTGLVQMLLLFALAPGYLALALGDPAGGREIRVKQVAAADPLSSERVVTLRLRVSNPGLTPLFADPARPATVRGRLLVTPASGGERFYDAEGVTLGGPLGARGSVLIALPLRLPHWVADGFLTWRVEGGDGQPFRLTGDSDVGFRFSNPAYRPLNQGAGNDLSALAARGRQIHHTTVLRAGEGVTNPRPANLVAGSLDTLFFSPLWGLPPKAPPGAGPFSDPRPFWVQLWQGYGALGVLLAAWFGLRLMGQAARVARQGLQGPGRLGWRLAPWSMALLVLTGFFSPVIGSFHVFWGLAMLSGYVEGRHDRIFPPRRVLVAPKPRRGRWGAAPPYPWAPPKPRRLWWPRRKKRFY